ELEPARSGPVASRSAQPTDSAGDDEPFLAALLRPGHRGNRERLRYPGHAADAPRVARLAGDRVYRPAVEHEGDAPVDRDLRDLSPGQRRPPRAGNPRPAQPVTGPSV